MKPSVLITGATGTFGRAYLRHALAGDDWRRVIAFSRDEVKQAHLYEEFGQHDGLRLFIGDVRSPDRLRRAMSGVDVVIHAAALKRVDVGAYSPTEMVETNVNGTNHVVQAAIDAGVGKVVVISSDKAVAATNIYGASKFCAETCAVQSNAYAPKTRICAVRYGNILGSRGSVVHIWRAQARAGGPLTLTSPEMTRFVMTIEQAVQLVDFALTQTEGGEVFLPALPAARMADLAEAVAPGRAHVVTGLRPGGEKLHESLLNEEEPARTRFLGATSRGPAYYAVLPSRHDWTTGRQWLTWGDPVPEGWVYRSDTTHHLSVDQLRALVDGTEACH